VSGPLCNLAAGELSSASLAAILIEALRTRATGEVVIETSGGTSRLYLREGHPRGVQVFFGFKPLGQFLLELGWIDIQALERSLLAVADGRKQGEALVSLGFLTAEQLATGLGLLHRAHLKTLAEVAEGTWTFEARDALPTWTDEVHIGAYRAIVDALGSGGGRGTARGILEEVRPGQKVRLRPAWETFTSHFELDEGEGAFVRSLLTPRTLPEMLAGATIDEARACALAAALLLMGVLIAQDEPAAAARETSAGPSARGISAGPSARGISIGPSARGISAGPSARGISAGPSARGISAGPSARGISAGPSARETSAGPAARGISAGPSARGISAGPSARGISAGPSARGISAGPAADEGELDRRIEAMIEKRHAAIAKGDKFAVLGLGRQASPAQIKQAYLEAVKLLHPDRLPATLSHLGPRARELFEAVTAANEILSDERKRRAYLGEIGRPKGGGPIRNPDVRQLVTKGEQLLTQRRFGQALAFFKQALLMEDHPDLRAHAIWAANADPARPLPDRARRELERLVERHPTCAVAEGYLSRLREDGTA